MFQITDLPISFCQLPHLKWLDLKGNPLNPTLKKVVGDCLNQKECEAAARKVIAHLKRLQAQVEMEREEKMRLERGKSTHFSFCFNKCLFMQHWSEGKENVIHGLCLIPKIKKTVCPPLVTVMSFSYLHITPDVLQKKKRLLPNKRRPNLPRSVLRGRQPRKRKRQSSGQRWRYRRRSRMGQLAQRNTTVPFPNLPSHPPRRPKSANQEVCVQGY